MSKALSQLLEAQKCIEIYRVLSERVRYDHIRASNKKKGSQEFIDAKRSANKNHRDSRKEFKNFYKIYNKIELPLNDGTVEHLELLNKLSDFEKKIYIFKSGLGTGISFHDEEITRASRQSKDVIYKAYNKALQLVTSYEKKDIVSSIIITGEIVSEIQNLSPELIKYIVDSKLDLNLLHWRTTEQLVAEFFASWGYETKLVGKNHFTGADIIAVKPKDTSGIEFKCFIEVKNTKEKVGIEIINQLVGSITSEKLTNGFHVGMIVSISGFKELRNWSQSQLKYLGVELRDESDVQNWLNDYKLSSNGLWLKY